MKKHGESHGPISIPISSGGGTKGVLVSNKERMVGAEGWVHAQESKGCLINSITIFKKFQIFSQAPKVVTIKFHLTVNYQHIIRITSKI